MKVLLTNDDGVQAPGLDALERLLARYAEVTVIAPDRHLSGCSHQVSTHRPIQVQQVAANRHAVDGTPADCVRLGLHHLAQNADWVIAGINDGGNLGVDIYMSGTVAAVREAAIHSKTGIAISQYRSPQGQVDWASAAELTQTALDAIWSGSCQSGSFWNVNLPQPDDNAATPDIIVCPLDRSPLPLRFQLEDQGFRYHGDYHRREKRTGTDVDVCFSGGISVTEMRID